MELSNQTDLYMSMQQFSEMKQGARNNSAKATESVAQQFESLFVQQMLSAMRAAATVDDASHNSYGDFYQEMYDKQLAMNISRQGGLGIADLIVRQLPPGQDIAGNAEKALPMTFDNTQASKAIPVDAKTPVLEAKRAYMNTPVFEAVPVNTKSTVSEAKHLDSKTLVSAVIPVDSNYQAENPAVVVRKLDIPVDETAGVDSVAKYNAEKQTPIEEFVRDIWPMAEQAANTLGISTRALVAQSALETGWGKHQMVFPDGQPSHNLFGIKAGSDWNGAILAKPTIEFRDGVMQTEMAYFRAYDSVADSLNDYVQFIQSRPRYETALNHQGKDENYLRGLQQAGYATDPAYADKIVTIMNGSTLNQALASLQPDSTQNLA